MRVTETSSDGYAPIVATKDYVDIRITEQGQTVPVATLDSVGGIRVGGDVIDVNLASGHATVNRASFGNSSEPSMGLVRIAPPTFTPQDHSYDDPTV